MLVEISLSRNCTRQSEVSHNASKVLIEGDDEACSHRVKLAGMLKSLAENIEKTIWFGRKDRIGFWLELFTLFLYYNHWLWVASWHAKMSIEGNLAEKLRFHSTWLFNLLFAQGSGWELKLTLQSCTECNTAGSSGGGLNSSRCHVFPSTLWWWWWRAKGLGRSHSRYTMCSVVSVYIDSPVKLTGSPGKV